MKEIVTHQKVFNCLLALTINNNSIKQFLFWTGNLSNYLNIENFKDIKTYINTNKYIKDDLADEQVIEVVQLIR